MIATTLILTMTALPPELTEAFTPTVTKVATQYHYETTDADQTFQAVISPQKPQGHRIDVRSPAKAEWPKGTQKMIRAMDADIDGDIWCDTLGDMVGKDVKQLSRNDTDISYQFKPIPGPDADKADKAFAKVAMGEIDIRRLSQDTLAPKWQIMAVRMKIQKPFKPIMIAKVHSFNMEITCAATPQGRMYQAKSETHMEGKAMGKTFKEDGVESISDVVLAN